MPKESKILIITTFKERPKNKQERFGPSKLMSKSYSLFG
jgi:hypothetical protein